MRTTNLTHLFCTDCAYKRPAAMTSCPKCGSRSACEYLPTKNRILKECDRIKQAYFESLRDGGRKMPERPRKRERDL